MFGLSDDISLKDIQYSSQFSEEFSELASTNELISPFDSYSPQVGEQAEDTAFSQDEDTFDEVGESFEFNNELNQGFDDLPLFNNNQDDFDEKESLDFKDELFFVDIDELFEPETDSADDYISVETKGVSLEERALQQAANFINEFGFDEAELPLFKEIFYINIRGWGQTRAALIRELGKGLTIEELHLAHEMRRVWALNDKFWVSYRRNGSFINSYYSLPWSIACLAAKTFTSIPCSEDIEATFNDIYCAWLQDSSLRFRFDSFSLYLASHFSELEENWHLYPFSTHSWPVSLYYSNYSDLGFSDPYNNKKEKRLRRLGFDYLYLV